MSDKFSIFFEIEDPKVISVNDAYMHPVRKTKTGRWRSYVCKSPALKSLQEFYAEAFKGKMNEENISMIKNYINSGPDCSLKLSIEFGFPRSYIFEFDVSNLIKAIEDCIATYIGVDDSKNAVVSVKKTISDIPRMRVCITSHLLENFDYEF